RATSSPRLVAGWLRVTCGANVRSPRRPARRQAPLASTSMSTRLSAGDPAPDFTLPDADGKPVSLSEFRGRRVIVYAYPAAGTSGCTKQACDFRDNLRDLNSAGL